MKINLQASAAQRLSAFLVILGLAVTLLGVIAPEPAHAYALDGHRWKYGTVCVIDHTGARWPVTSATSRWSGVPDLSYRYGGSCSQKIHVYEGWYGSSWHGGKHYGWTTPWLYTHKTYGDYERLGNAWRSYRCTIQMNNTYGARLSWADRRSALMHEFGHCDGLKHTSSNSLMNIYRWHFYDYPAYDDRRGVEARYPW